MSAGAHSALHSAAQLAHRGDVALLGSLLDSASAVSRRPALLHAFPRLGGIDAPLDVSLKPSSVSDSAKTKLELRHEEAPRGSTSGTAWPAEEGPGPAESSGVALVSAEEVDSSLAQRSRHEDVSLSAQHYKGLTEDDLQPSPEQASHGEEGHVNRIVAEIEHLDTNRLDVGWGSVGLDAIGHSRVEIMAQPSSREGSIGGPEVEGSGAVDDDSLQLAPDCEGWENETLDMGMLSP